MTIGEFMQPTDIHKLHRRIRLHFIVSSSITKEAGGLINSKCTLNTITPVTNAGRNWSQNHLTLNQSVDISLKLLLCFPLWHELDVGQGASEMWFNDRASDIMMLTDIYLAAELWLFSPMPRHMVTAWGWPSVMICTRLCSTPSRLSRARNFTSNFCSSARDSRIGA